MANLPSLGLTNLGASLKILLVDNTDLVRDKRFTFLTEDVVSPGTTIRVQSILGFENVSTSSGQIIVIGEIGNERTEIRRTTNSSSNGYPSQTYKEIALFSALNFDHPQDTKISIIDWDRIEFDYAGTASGVKATLTAYPQPIQPDQLQTVYRETQKDGVFYFARFNDSIETRNSSWSDPVYSGGYDDNSVFNIKKRALDSLGEEIDGSVITHDFLNQSLWEARREYHQARGKRPFRRKYNTAIGVALTGSYRIELPTDVEKPYGAENIYGVRVGTEANMRYYDKKEWDFDYRNKPHSTLTTAYVRGARDLYVASARDFAGSGAVMVENSSVSYSEKSNAGGTLRISADGAHDASAGSDVWQNISYGLPDRFTVFADPQGSAYIYFNRPLETAYIDQNIYADYYRTLVGYDSDADVLDEPQYDMFTHYLMAKIKHRRAKGGFNITEDSDYKLWQFKKNSALEAENLSVDIRISPDIEHLIMPN